MALQLPITIKTALSKVQKQEYVLPAIQREFVWDQDQICALFDSLLQGYPIGSFLFWRVAAEQSQDFKFYGFIRDYHALKNRHCPLLDVPKQEITAILDGQQRLTALNVGLRGSHAEKEPRKWWNNPNAYPSKRLYLNLSEPAPENERGLKFDLRFLAPDRVAGEAGGPYWFPVHEVFDFSSGKDVFKVIQKADLVKHERAYDVLHELYSIVHEKPIIPYFEETEQDLDKVLNIFIRVNSAGTPLSYSDLLLSIATAQWKNIDARDVIHELVDDLNNTKNGFQVSKDLVLKSGLMLSEVQSVTFRVTNFNAKNMQTLEKEWTEIAAAVQLGVQLLGDFGFSAQNLAAESVLIPVAYYLHKRGLGQAYLTNQAHKKDRELIRGWVCRSLVKSGVWGSGLDTLLVALRTVLHEKGTSSFPVEALEQAMARRGKPLRFTEDELEDLLDSPYGDKRTFALLSLMYPFVDLRNVFHVDHIFPWSRFTARRLAQAGVPAESLGDFRERANRLPNLQLLEGALNQSKLAKMPAAWIADSYPKAAAAEHYRDLHDLGTVPAEMTAFSDFYDARRDKMLKRLRSVLAVSSDSAGT